MNKPTKIQFETYVDIQQSGVTNMFETEMVSTYADEVYNVYLPRSVIFEICKNYKELTEEYKS